ncbi:hypothetical protein PI124_g20064 [Phytophthora idaei]|nr:hypothetical protein PI125_g20600 [Phytophthora idaei]KAG3132010.1 hypothetical protein PI126_g19822 [Phytophthora idaei]KAG3234885.1 hypothetical protein PI124_g20064 [Phytophthora idaei]
MPPDSTSSNISCNPYDGPRSRTETLATEIHDGFLNGNTIDSFKLPESWKPLKKEKACNKLNRLNNQRVPDDDQVRGQLSESKLTVVVRQDMVGRRGYVAPEGAESSVWRPVRRTLEASLLESRTRRCCRVMSVRKKAVLTVKSRTGNGYRMAGSCHERRTGERTQRSSLLKWRSGAQAAHPTNIAYEERDIYEHGPLRNQRGEQGAHEHEGADARRHEGVRVAGRANERAGRWFCPRVDGGVGLRTETTEVPTGAE